MSLIRISEDAVRRTAEKIQRDADRLAPARPRGILRNTINGELFIPVERAAMTGARVIRSRGLPDGVEPPSTAVTLDPPGRLTVSAQEPLDAKPGDRWINSMTGEQHVFRALGGITTEEAGIRMKAALGGCTHANPEPVELTTGEVVAAVCPDCLQPLPPSYVGSDWKP